MPKQAKIFIGIVVVVILGLIIAAGITINSTNVNVGGQYTAIAQCLKEKGVIFYGAFWCPHCKAQKAAFGSAVQYLPYHECSTPDASGMLPDCQAAGVQEYPTWVFPDGSRLTGVQDPEVLAEKAGCVVATSTSSSSLSLSSISTSTVSTSSNASKAY